MSARGCDVYNGCADCVAEQIVEQENDRLADIAAENARRAQFGGAPIGCEACGARDLTYNDYVYGSDADGRRGERRKEWECNMCGAAVRA